MPEVLLEVRNLSTQFVSKQGVVRAIDGVCGTRADRRQPPITIPDSVVNASTRKPLVVTAVLPDNYQDNTNGNRTSLSVNLTCQFVPARRGL